MIFTDITLPIPAEIMQLILLNSLMKFNEKAKTICEQLCVLREENKLEDQFALPKECQALANAIASQGTEVEYVIIENSGHSTLAEQPRHDN